MLQELQRKSFFGSTSTAVGGKWFVLHGMLVQLASMILQVCGQQDYSSNAFKLTLAMLQGASMNLYSTKPTCLKTLIMPQIQNLLGLMQEEMA